MSIQIVFHLKDLPLALLIQKELGVGSLAFFFDWPFPSSRINTEEMKEMTGSAYKKNLFGLSPHLFRLDRDEGSGAK